MSDVKETRSKAQIEQDIAAARARLANNVEELIQEVHPKSIAQRSLSDAKDFAQAEFENAKTYVQREDGSMRWDILMIGAGAVAGVITFFAVLKSIFKRA